MFSLSNARNGHNAEYYRKRLTKLSRVLFKLRVIRLYPNCDSVGIQFNWYHPVSFFYFCFIVIFVFLLDGVIGLTTAWKEDRFGFGIKKYFKKHPEQFEYIPHFGEFDIK
ncbi:hypothetical protein A6E13_01850 [Aliivibrio fischeri]|uniref:hypothetical protein n=1 Tax=Aliivibrio fischeri TaxID=668 RepID=UPI00080E2CFC|nr:hypothetical protein [Aliivibrio fischeri]OCH31299.1 hypothetical protein A6E13_01850 [Aliivibrio fischeri]